MDYNAASWILTSGVGSMDCTAHSYQPAFPLPRFWSGVCCEARLRQFGGRLRAERGQQLAASCNGCFRGGNTFWSISTLLTTTFKRLTRSTRSAKWTIQRHTTSDLIGGQHTRHWTEECYHWRSYCQFERVLASTDTNLPNTLTGGFHEPNAQSSIPRVTFHSR